MSERDKDRRSRVGTHDKASAESVPGKHANTDVFETGAMGPTPRIPGKRSATEALEPLGTLPTTSAKSVPEPTRRALKTQTGSPIPDADRFAEKLGFDISFARV